MTDSLTIALSKGRILKQTLPLLEAAGVALTERPEDSRKLVLSTTDPNIKVFIVRATDVPTYVQHGAADLGVVGKDTLIEHGGEGLYAPLDLEIARCRLSVAGMPGVNWLDSRKRLKVATKYVRAARNYFAERRQQVDIIKLYGSMELAPIIQLADIIVDVVDTGSTLRANGLTELQPIMPISSRLVVNKASSKMKHRRVSALVEALGDAVQSNRKQAAETS